MADPNITQIPAPRVDFIDPRTGLMSRQWYRFFLNLFNLTGGDSNATSLADLQVGPPQPASTDVATYFQDAVLTPAPDTAELKQQIDALDQEVSLLPSFSSLNSGAYFNIVGPPTAGSVAYGDGNSLVFNPVRISIAPSTGNVTVNAPVSGTALAVSGLSGAVNTPIAAFSQSTNGTNFSINSPTGAGAYLFSSAAGDSVLRAEANNLVIGSVSGSTSIATASRTIATFNSTGNVTINPPASANSLTVNGVTGAATVVSVNTTSGAGSEYHFQATNGTDSNFNLLVSQVGAASKYTHLFTATNTPLYLGTNGTIRASIEGAGSVVIGSPTGGGMGAGTLNATGLYVNGVAVSTGGGGGGSGTVTSVDVSGSTTGLTFSGGPVTTSGTITMAGTLAIANGGTNGTATPTAGAIAYGTGTAYGFTAAGTTGQVLTSAAAATPTWTSQSALSVGSATTATNIASGAANQIHYQTGAGATSFITAPTVASTNLQWNGSAFVWAASSSFSGGTLTSQLILAAGTASAGTAPMEFQSGTVNTTAEAGALEYDGAVFYATPNTTSGRGYKPSIHIFRLAANGTAFGPAIGNFFGANSAINLVGGGVYEIEAHCYFTKTTAGTVVVTATTSLAPANLSGVIQTGVITGGTATGAAQQIALFNSTATGAAFGATGSLTTAVNHYMKISLIVEANASASNLRINFTSSAGTVTPLRTSYYKVTRLPAGNTGLYAA